MKQNKTKINVRNIASNKIKIKTNLTSTIRLTFLPGTVDRRQNHQIM